MMIDDSNCGFYDIYENYYDLKKYISNPKNSSLCKCDEIDYFVENIESEVCIEDLDLTKEFCKKLNKIKQEL